MPANRYTFSFDRSSLLAPRKSLFLKTLCTLPPFLNTRPFPSPPVLSLSFGPEPGRRASIPLLRLYPKRRTGLRHWRYGIVAAGS